MIKCPSCGNYMVYIEGENSRGHYEFYGCSTYPHCNKIVRITDAHKYDDGKVYERPERSIEEEAEDFRDLLLKEGYSWDAAEEARRMWEKD